jgi:hypothetical protein
VFYGIAQSDQTHDKLESMEIIPCILQLLKKVVAPFKDLQEGSILTIAPNYPQMYEQLKLIKLLVKMDLKRAE